MPPRRGLLLTPVRALSTQPARAAPRYAGAVAAGAGVAAFALYQLNNTVKLEGKATIAGEYKTASERSFIMIKPDGVSRQLVGKIIDKFESEFGVGWGRRGDVGVEKEVCVGVRAGNWQDAAAEPSRRSRPSCLCGGMIRRRPLPLSSGPALLLAARR